MKGSLGSELGLSSMTQRDVLVRIESLNCCLYHPLPKAPKLCTMWVLMLETLSLLESCVMYTNALDIHLLPPPPPRHSPHPRSTQDTSVGCTGMHSSSRGLCGKSSSPNIIWLQGLFRLYLSFERVNSIQVCSKVLVWETLYVGFSWTLMRKKTHKWKHPIGWGSADRSE